MKRRLSLGVVLAATMAVATVGPGVFSVLATTLRAEFGVARWQVGALVTAVMGVGALLSPVAGSFTDRIAPHRSTAATLVMSALSFGGMALAPTFGLVAAAAVAAGFSQALANPATNLLIMSRAEVGRRGVLTGIKQGGVQAGFGPPGRPGRARSGADRTTPLVIGARPASASALRGGP